MEKTENIVILGAGPAGISTALFLAKAGISPVVLERSNFPRDKVCGDALSGKVVEVLKKINPEWVDDLAAQPAHLGSWGVSFFAPDRNCLRVPFRRTPKPGENAPGYIAKRIDFDNWWFQKAVNEPLISIRQNVHPNSFVKTSEGWIISDEKGDEIVRTKLIIAADGALSKFAKNPGGFHMEPRHYCAGIRAYYKNVKDCDSENFIELHFLKDLLPGYFWIFPLPNGLCNVGIGMRSDTIASKKLNLKKELQKILNEDPVFKARFSESEILGPVQGFGLPLGSKK